MISVLGAYFRSPRVKIAASLYVILSALLARVPLFNYLGYEFAAAMTVPAALISGIMTLQFFDEHRRKPITKRTWLYIIGDYLHVNFLLLLIPLVVISLNALIVKNCAFGKGMAFYLLLPMVTMVFSVSLALLIGSLFRRSKTVFVVTVFGLLSHIVFITYTKPQLFAYNVVLGFFPGITYDEAVGDMMVLVLFRQFTILAALLFLLFFSVSLGYWSPSRTVWSNLADLRKTIPANKFTWSCILVVFGSLLYGYLYRSELGFEHSAGDIQRQLGRRSESAHFIFYYSSGDYSMKDMIRVRNECEQHYRIVSERLQSDGGGKKIEVYIYPSVFIKQRLIGTANTNIAKPWKREIHVTAATLAGSFRHELVHIVAGDFGFPVIRASTRMGLNEGLAVAVDWETGLFTPHHYSAALLRENALENIGPLFSLTGFATRPPAVAYTVAGSFCRYLIDRFGIERVKRCFPNGNFVLTFSESAESLIKDWEAFLKTIDTSELTPETIKAHFFQQSIFFKDCAREVAEKNKQAAEALRVRDFKAAELYYTASYDNAPALSSLRGMMQTLIAQNKFDEARLIFEQLPEKSLLRINPVTLYYYADALFFLGKAEEASSLYATILDMKYSEPMMEAAALRQQMIAEGIEKEVIHILYYTNPGDSVRKSILARELEKHPSSFFCRYVFALLELRLLNVTGAEKVLAALRDDIPSLALRYFVNVHSADIEYQRGNLEMAKLHFWNARNYVLTPALNDYLEERIELCDALTVE